MRGGSGPPRPRFGALTAAGRPLDPINEYAHDVLWWLDKMIRAPRPLNEKMTLFWHDHFATLDQDRPLLIAQNKMLRRDALGSFRRLLTDVTKDPAMLLFLSLVDSTKEEPNENYARELMELFTLGKGYTEKDIREASRALTGFRAKRRGDGTVAVLYDRKARDATSKTIFGHRGNHDYRDVLDLCIAHPQHAPFLVSKLWEYFVGTPIEPSGRTRLARVYRRSGHRIAPVVRRDPRAPRAVPLARRAGHDQVAGRLRRGRAARLRTGHHARQLGPDPRRHGPAAVPPAVGRGLGVGQGVAVDEHDARALRRRQRAAHGHRRVRKGAAPTRDTPRQAVARARSAVGRPWTSPATDAQLLKLATRLLSDDPPPPGGYRMALQQRADMCQRVLRQLLLAAPTRRCTEMARQPLPGGCDDFRATSESERGRFLGGSQLTRRQVLGWGVGAGLALYAAKAMPVTRALEAAAADAAAAPDAPVLVAVFLPGGLDLLDSLIPVNDFGAYADLHRNVLVDRRRCCAAARSASTPR